MTDNQKKWLYVIAVIAIPFLLVWLFNSAISRLLAVIWVFTALPGIFLYGAFNPRLKILADTSRLNKTTNPDTLRKWTIVVRVVSFIAGIAWLLYFTLPIWSGAYKVFALKESFIEITDSVVNQSAPVLATGIYWNLKLRKDPQTGYMYLFPTKYRFGESEYQFLVLPGTQIILSVESK